MSTVLHPTHAEFIRIVKDINASVNDIDPTYAKSGHFKQQITKLTDCFVMIITEMRFASKQLQDIRDYMEKHGVDPGSLDEIIDRLDQDYGEDKA